MSCYQIELGHIYRKYNSSNTLQRANIVGVLFEFKDSNSDLDSAYRFQTSIPIW